MPSSDLSRTHPEMVRRLNALRKLVEAEGGMIGWTSSWRPKELYEEPPTSQRRLYRQYLAGGNLAANPDGLIGQTDWGWVARGSWHMVQDDGHSHALDLWWSRISQARVEELAYKVGLRRTVPSEAWHYQWYAVGGGVFDPGDPSTLIEEQPEQPQPEEDDDMATAIISNDGDPAIFVTDGISKRWVQNGDVLQTLMTNKIVKATLGLDGHFYPIVVSRETINELITVGPWPIYNSDYTGPRTTSS